MILLPCRIENGPGGIAGTASGNDTNGTVTGNTAVIGGGAFNFASTPTFKNSTIRGNGGGILNFVNGTVELKYTIVAKSVAGGDYPTSLAYNLDGDGTCNLTSVGDAPNNPNAKLVPLQNNGGSAGIHTLLAGSDAIGLGDADECKNADGNAATTGQRGVSWPLNPV